MSLAEFAGPEQVDLAARAALVATSLQGRGREALEVVFSAGLMVEPVRGMQVMVMVASGMVEQPPGRYLLPEVPRAMQVVAAALGLPAAPGWVNEIRTLVMPPPEPQLAPGDPITNPTPGRVGCGASWTGGNGFLTAGHVAQKAKTSIMNGTTGLGTVLFANDPTGNMSPGADVGVIELASGTTFTPSLSGTTAAAPNDSVQVLKGGSASADIMSFATFVYLPSISGTYGDTYSTTQSVTSGGDSGSAVGLSGANVGIVVAGTTNYTTYIQDIRYLIAAAKPSVPGLTV
jgi:hypothetical protein